PLLGFLRFLTRPSSGSESLARASKVPGPPSRISRVGKTGTSLARDRTLRHLGRDDVVNDFALRRLRPRFRCFAAANVWASSRRPPPAVAPVLKPITAPAGPAQEPPSIAPPKPRPMTSPVLAWL